MCPAWGQTCRVCGKENPFERICQSKGEEKQGAMQCIEDEEAAIDALIAHIVFDPVTRTYKPGNSGLEELEVTLIPFFPCPNPRRIRDIPAAHSTKLKIYPDSSATIFLGGFTHLQPVELSERNLIPLKKKVCTIGGFSLVCQGWLPVTFESGNRTTKQALYICNKIQVIYFSKVACIDVGILPPSYPRPMTSLLLVTWNVIHPGTQPHKTDPPPNKPKFDYPKTPSYPPISENLKNLKKWLLDRFAITVFNKNGKFQAMSSLPAHIHLKDGAIPKAKHNPDSSTLPLTGRK